MEPPMSNWFASVPQTFDTLAFSTRVSIRILAICEPLNTSCTVSDRKLGRACPLLQEEVGAPARTGGQT